MGYKQCVEDMYLYRKQDGEDVVVVGVYVDDLLTTSSSAESVDRLFVSLVSLSIEDLGSVKGFRYARIT